MSRDAKKVQTEKVKWEYAFLDKDIYESLNFQQYQC